MMRLFLVCACARALAPPARRLTRRDAVDAADLVGGTWAGWQREFDVEGGTAPAGYELTSRERLDGDVLERSFVTPVERSTSVVDAGRLVASDGICVFDDDDRQTKDEHHLRTTFASDAGSRVRVTLRTTRDGRAVSPRKPRLRIAVESRGDLPSARTLAKFAAPTLGAWLISPMLTLVDTAVVGRSGTSIELAALGPGTLIGDNAAYLFSFLSVATTNLIATALAEDKDVSSLFASAVRLAVVCGVASASAQLVFGKQLLARYTAKQSAAIVGPAFAYARVRAMGAPFALLCKVSVAFCLASKDAITPLLALLTGGVINLGLDILLVCGLGRGVAGAAAATVVSEALVAAALLTSARRRLFARRHAGDSNPGLVGSTPSPLKPRLPAAAAVARRFLPSRNETATFARYARPLVVTLLGKIAAYSTLAHVATADGVAATAAHRILMGLYWAFWPFAEVGSQIGQAFLPGARQKWPLTRRLLKVGVGVGLGSALAATAALYSSGAIFTADAAVVQRLRGLAPLAAACVACLAPMCAMEGALLAKRDLGFLSMFYAINAAAMVTAFSVIERVGLGIGAAWCAMLAFQIARLGAFGLRLRRSRPQLPRWATDAWAGAREEKGMRWFPGGVGLRFENGAVRIAHQSKAVERRFDADSGDMLDLRFLL
jgi:Na+-driven multidrug efflux pump